MTQLESESPNVSLHGGITGFDQLDWDVIDLTESKLFSDKEKQSIGSCPAFAIFRLVSPDGDQGYPGALLIEAVVGLLQSQEKPDENAELAVGSVVLVYRAALLSKDVVTPINLTQHWGFTLDASLTEKYGPEALNIKGHRLTIQAPYICEVDAIKMPTGKLISTDGTAHAHKKKVIGDNFPSPGGYGRSESFVIQRGP